MIVAMAPAPRIAANLLEMTFGPRPIARLLPRRCPTSRAVQLTAIRKVPRARAVAAVAVGGEAARTVRRVPMVRRREATITLRRRGKCALLSKSLHLPRNRLF
jgi:hypothetical protein